MLSALPQLLAAPMLIGAASLAARWWGHHVGGLVSAFPAVVGPVLLIAAQEHGPAFAAKAASGTLLGLVALSGFALAYGRAARHVGWRTSLAAGWATAALIAALLTTVDPGPFAAAAVAAIALATAHRTLPAGEALLLAPATAPPRWDLPLRMLLTAVLVVALAAAATSLGPIVGGLLAGLPVLASVLAVFTHDRQGAAALAALLRGMLRGMAGFAVFCLLVAVLVDHAGVAIAFVAAALAAVAVQAACAAAAFERPV